MSADSNSIPSHFRPFGVLSITSSRNLGGSLNVKTNLDGLNSPA